MLQRLSLILFFALSGCATLLENNPNAVYIRNVDWALLDIRGVCLAQLPAGPGGQSSNGRELRSKQFFTSRTGYKEADDKTNDRYTAQFTILGSERPYDVEVVVVHERRVLRGGSPTYVKLGYDARLTKELSDKLRIELSKRREERNIIDDFRVY
jgi:hypothetical protein